MLYRYFGLLGSTPPVSFVAGDVLVYPTIVALLIAAVLCLRRQLSGARTFAVLCFVLYMSMVLEVTLFPVPLSYAEVVAARGHLGVAPDINLIPLQSIVASVAGIRLQGPAVFVLNWVGNLLLLLPMGLLAPFLWRRFTELSHLLVLSASVALSIELTQFVGSFLILGIRWKSVDVDDVIVNIVGAMIGFCLARLLARAGGSPASHHEEDA